MLMALALQLVSWGLEINMTGIKDYSTTAASNTALFPEGMNPAQVNNSARQLQADVRDFYETPEWRDLGYTPVYASSTSFTVAQDITSKCSNGQRLKLYGSTMGTLYASVTSVVYSSPNTTVTVKMDSGSLTSNLSAVYFGLNPSNSPLPASAIAGSIGLVKDPFVGDGTTVTFTLTKSVDSALNVLWLEGGVLQEPNVDYTVSGKTVTRTTAPASGVSIFALTMAPFNTASIPDASLVEMETAIRLGENVQSAMDAVNDALVAAESDISDAQTDITSLQTDLAQVRSGTHGDVFYIASTGKAARLAAGTANQVLKTNGASSNPSFGWEKYVQRETHLLQTPSTGTTQIPDDTTIPQSIEGDQYLTVSITPKSATSKLIIQGQIYLSFSSSTVKLCAALFKDSDTDALAVFTCSSLSAQAMPVPIYYEISTGSTTPVTFKIRAGGGSAGTTSVNQSNGGTVTYGGKITSYLTVIEQSA